MKNNKKKWVLTTKNNRSRKLSLSEKQEISDYFQLLVNEFNSKCIVENPDKEHNYLIDIYTKWYRDFFYFCEKFKSEYPNRIENEFELKFVRLKYTGVNQFEFSYFRHTNQWHSVDENLSKEECLRLILSNPLFQP